ncbi:OmpA/MotB family protein [Taklimakanibacter lacteus]|uniref:OmpA/MotB family protein n=1 Tax=Taklimakanibacter lacteus TaxID=2268456 RepID=UPI000E66A2B9
MIVAEAEAGTQAEEGENYFISMTDMMVGVLFIFIIMLMVFALEFRTTTDTNEDALQKAREAAKSAQEAASELESFHKDVADELKAIDEAQQARTQLLHDLETQMHAKGLDVKIDEVNGVLRLTEQAVRFEPDSSEIGDVARQNISTIAEVLNEVLPQYTACDNCGERRSSTLETVFIEGHTDKTGVLDPEMRDQRNWQLSAERSVNTYREIIARAPALKVLHNQSHQPVLSVSGYSSTRPIDLSDNKDGYAKNRRIDLRFVMEVNRKERLKEILKITDDMRTRIQQIDEAIVSIRKAVGE